MDVRVVERLKRGSFCNTRKTFFDESRFSVYFSPDKDLLVFMEKEKTQMQINLPENIKSSMWDASLYALGLCVQKALGEVGSEAAPLDLIKRFIENAVENQTKMWQQDWLK